MKCDGSRKKEMKILLIEDDVGFAESLIHRILSAAPGVKIEFCRDKLTGMNQLSSNFFDLIILDLTIPLSPNQPAMSETNGQEIFYEAIKLSPGTPIRILTSSDPDDFILDSVTAGEKVRPWGLLKIDEIRYYKKREYSGLLADVVACYREVEEISKVEINTSGRELSLSELEVRAVKIFTRIYNGASCIIEKLSPGLSGSLILRVQVQDDQGADIVNSVAKIGTSKVQTEMDSREWANRLPIGACPHILLELSRSLKNVSALFYAASSFKPYFELFVTHPEMTAKIVPTLNGYLDGWANSRKRGALTVSEVRRRFVTDDFLLSVVAQHGISVGDVENCNVMICSSIVHGDFHAGNVLVDHQSLPVIIDFGDTGEGFTCVDPIALELSLIFHPDSTVRDQSIKNIEDWPNLENYILGHPHNDFIHACRQWAYKVGGGDKAVLAIAYAHTLKQFKYETVPASVLVSLINSIINKLINNL